MRRVSILLLFFASSALAQLPIIAFSGGGGGSQTGGFQGNATFRLPIPTGPVVVNAPYSGQQTDQVSQTLADGTHINRTTGMQQKAWRDSQGRVRTERSFVSGTNTLKNVPTLVQIFDPVSRYIYVMDDVTRVVHRVSLSANPQTLTFPAPALRSPAAAGQPGQAGQSWASQVSSLQSGRGGLPDPILNRPPTNVIKSVPRQFSSEQLGTQYIEGVLVTGTRTTTVIPAGAQGNDAPITTTRDTWYSAALHLNVLIVTTDPRSGVNTSQIANLSTNEPDPALFMLPGDYSIVDETGASFTIKWGDQ